mmetsp:Transcript_17575/g.21629  ORF Transcript_17575/g.21629 Transcript_17575/m.21629 type:complete len:315 (+) Transcript_17575:311-1255(+)
MLWNLVESNKIKEGEDERTRSSKRRRAVEAEADADTDNETRKKNPTSSSLYEAQINDLKAEEKAVKNGKHADFKELCRNLEKVRDRKLQDAELVRDLRVKEAEALYKFETKSAKDAFEVAKNTALDKIVAEIHESIKKLEDVRDGVVEEEDSSATRAKTRSLRSKAKKDGKDDKELDSLPSEKISNNCTISEKKKTKVVGPIGLDFFMEDNDIENDLEFIHSNWKKTAEKFDGTRKDATVKFADGKLTYKGKVFRKDSDVIIQTQLTKEELFGVITGANKTELQVKLVDGSKARVLYTHLRSGRCTIDHNTNED